MRFREYGAKKPVIQGDKAAIVAYLRDQFAHWPDLDHLDPANIRSEYLGFTLAGKAARPSTHTWYMDWPALYLVTLPGYGVIGYSDEALGP